MKINLPRPLSLHTLARMAGGEVIDHGTTMDIRLTHVCTDSREADAHTLFCALRGERVDGHDYMGKAAELGCRAFLCERVPSVQPEGEGGFIRVASTLQALSAMAQSYRMEELGGMTAVAVTGSVGKTTTKEMLAAVLSEGGRVFKKEGNYNSTIGLPLTLLEIPSGTTCAVLEMGMSERGEIESMTRAARPNVALVTNVGSSHLEKLGSRENIARAKLEIATGLSSEGVLLLNGDEPLLDIEGEARSALSPEGGVQAPPSGVRVLRLSLKGREGADYKAHHIDFCGEGMTFDLTTPEGEWRDLYVPSVGEHFVWAGGFAAAVGQLLGLGEAQVRRGLAAYRPASLRQRLHRLRGVTVVEDCYNAAPESMRAALSALALLSGGEGGPNATHPSASLESRRIAVLGDMRELGEDQVALHRAVGRFAAEKGIDLLIPIGELGGEIAAGALEAGLPAEAIQRPMGEDVYAAVVAYLKRELREGDHVLFKASRAMQLERILEPLLRELELENTPQGEDTPRGREEKEGKTQ